MGDFMLKRNLLLILTIFLGMMMLGLSAEARNVCVLIYERQASRVSEATVDIFRKRSGVKIYTEATPADFIECLDGRYDEVVVVAHTMKQKAANGSDLYKLGYFVPVRGGYMPRVFLSKTFEVATERNREQKQRGQRTSLKRLRIMACAPKLLLSSNPALRALAIEAGIKLDFAPVSPVMSFFKNESVVGFNSDWLKRSL
jgi:hypothetical protein